MKYVNDWDMIKKRFTAWWDGEIIDRCCASITINNAAAVDKEHILDFPKDKDELFKFWTDPEQLIKRNRFFIPLRKLITIHTVDGFQGQERDVILISLVRANSEGNIGFLNDLRRMNVAITRARMKLIILGDATTLTSHPFSKALYEYIREKGKIIEIQPETPDTFPS